MTPEHGDTYYDRQEVRSPAEREAAMLNALPGLIRHAIDNTPWFADRLAGIEPDSVASRAALARLPVLRHAELVAAQAAHPPFGGLTATPLRRLARIFAASGPVYEPEGARTDYWRFARALYAAGFRPGDLVHNSFSYHLTPAGMMVERGARALACPVVPAGTGDLALQLRAIADLQPVAYAGPPSILLDLLDRGRALGIETGSLGRALLAGETLSAAARERLAGEFAIDVYEAYATPELGLIAYESSAHGGLLVDESVIVEIVRPGSGELVAEGEVGEVVVTAFNPDYPLVRYATGDLGALIPGESPCGRTNARLHGPLGRADARLHGPLGRAAPASL